MPKIDVDNAMTFNLTSLRQSNQFAVRFRFRFRQFFLYTDSSHQGKANLLCETMPYRQTHKMGRRRMFISANSITQIRGHLVTVYVGSLSYIRVNHCL